MRDYGQMLRSSRSPHSVGVTADRILAALESRGIEVFARIDHAAAARSAGLELKDEQVLIFGNPKVGTRLMQSEPQVGYELPLRLLIWDADGQTMVGYLPAIELANNYALADHAEVLAGMGQLLEQLVIEGVASR